MEEEKEEDGESWGEGTEEGEGREGEKEEIKGMRTGEKTFSTDILHL